MSKNKISVSKVNILGQEYFIKSSAKSNYFKEVSRYVNKKMKEIIDGGVDPNTQQLKIAVLACMNITDELLSYKKESDTLLTQIGLKSSTIIEYIDDKLDK